MAESSMDFPTITPTILPPDSDSSTSIVDVEVSEEFYFDDGDLFILAEQTLFRIHSHFIRKHSASLRGVIWGSNGVGSTVRNPLEVTIVSASKLAGLLWVFYDETFERDAPAEKWVSILLTAEKLEMEHVIDLAIRKLEHSPIPLVIDPISIITIHDRHYIREDWANDAYVSLCTREEPLSEDEVSLLGFRLTALVARGRESVAKAILANHSVFEAPYMDPSKVKEKRAHDVLLTYGKKTAQSRRVPSQVLDEMHPYDFHVEGGNITVKVGDSDFKVHRYFLAHHSPLLAQMIPSRESETDKQWDVLDDESEEASVYLRDIKAEDFSWLLWLLYDEPFTSPPSPKPWTAIRGLAEKYSMKYIGTLSTRKLGDQLDLIERVLSIERYNIAGTWSAETMNELYAREHPPSAEEGKRLGWDLWERISIEREKRLREELAQWEPCTTCHQIEAPSPTTSSLWFPSTGFLSPSAPPPTRKKKGRKKC